MIRSFPLTLRGWEHPHNLEFLLLLIRNRLSRGIGHDRVLIPLVIIVVYGCLALVNVCLQLRKGLQSSFERIMLILNPGVSQGVRLVGGVILAVLVITEELIQLAFHHVVVILSHFIMKYFVAFLKIQFKKYSQN